MGRWIVVLALLAGCGRIGYDPVTDAARSDSAVDASIDVPIDAIPVCPAGTTEIVNGSSVCIQLTENGTDVWLPAKAACEGMGWRLCTGTEWATGCTYAQNLVNILGEWEWVAEESAGIAAKHGATTCAEELTHVITDPYDYRCCADKI